MEQKLDVWKQGVSRATAFTQSNASFQVQIAGYFFSAIVVAVAVAKPDNQKLLFLLFIPCLSILLLLISSAYFNFLTIQQTFINLYGRTFDPAQQILCHEQFSDLMAKEGRSKFFACLKYLAFRTPYSGPYFPIFWLYILTPQFSIWGWTYFNSTGSFTWMRIGELISLFAIEFFCTVWITIPAWSAHEYAAPILAANLQRKT